MADHDTLCGWGDKGKVAYFLENADTIVPRRREQLTFLCELFSWPHDAAISVLDLGAGFGAISDEILSRYPNATVTCVDGSEAMIKLTRERLRKYGDHVRLHFADLASATWRSGIDGPFDAAVSGLAIHHLDDVRKGELYREVYALLRPGGLLLNNDIVSTPPALKERFETLTFRAIQEQDQAKRGIGRPLEEIEAEMREQFRLAGGQHHSQIAPLRDQLAWLSDAGFKSVDCYWKYLDLAIFGGAKQ
jgi:cyclopropane fatty-acyl-phospholipid synthase-like methyltransferase